VKEAVEAGCEASHPNSARAAAHREVGTTQVIERSLEYDVPYREQPGSGGGDRDDDGGGGGGGGGCGAWR
jgi:hypothetical protein